MKEDKHNARRSDCSTVVIRKKGIEGEAFDKTDYVSEHHQAPLALKKNIMQRILSEVSPRE